MDSRIHQRRHGSMIKRPVVSTMPHRRPPGGATASSGRRCCEMPLRNDNAGPITLIGRQRRPDDAVENGARAASSGRGGRGRSRTGGLARGVRRRLARWHRARAGQRRGRAGPGRAAWLQRPSRPQASQPCIAPARCCRALSAPIAATQRAIWPSAAWEGRQGCPTHAGTTAALDPTRSPGDRLGPKLSSRRGA